ncbi:MAG: AI-2E family transporter, partial [Anaerolineae bacterium]|nr:AI-2E family transporter [Anaerolineae bacterium]
MSESTTPEDQPGRSNPIPSNVLEIGRNIVQERFFFFLVLALLGFLALLLIWPNLLSILTAIALVVILKPLYNRFLEKKWVAGSTNRATAVTIVTFLVLIAVPLILFIWLAVNQANELLANTFTGNNFTAGSFMEGVQTFLQDLAVDEQISLAPEDLAASLQENMASFTSLAADALVNMAGWLIQFFTAAVIILVVMMVLLPRFKTPEQDQMAALIPFPPDITNLYLEKVQLMIMAMFKGTFVLAVIQGAAMGLVFLIAGVPYVFLLTILSMFLSLLPMIGISLI